MPATKNALIRYRAIDSCLRDRMRNWTLQDIVDKCNEALYEAEVAASGVSIRSIQYDIQLMRSDKLGYNAPIEVYNRKYYRYSDPTYSIFGQSLSSKEMELIGEVASMLFQMRDYAIFSDMGEAIDALIHKLFNGSERAAHQIIHFDSMPLLRGFEYIKVLYQHIKDRSVIKIGYKSFSSKSITYSIVSPYLLKEFRNRWFLIASKQGSAEINTFALDRIESVTLQSDIEFQDNDRFDPQQFFDDVIGVTKSFNSKPRTIEFITSPRQTDYIRTKPLHQSQSFKRLYDDGRGLFSITVVPTIELYSVFLSYGAGIKVISPQKVVRHLQTVIDQMHKQYQ